MDSDRHSWSPTDRRPPLHPHTLTGCWLPAGEWEFGCGASARFWCRVSLIKVSLNVKCAHGPLDILQITLHTTTPRTTATTTTTDRHNDTQHSAVRTTHNRRPNSQLQRKEVGGGRDSSSAAALR
eukprot:scaffold4892_cov119-Isochrysis_galbana.AAC.1